MNRAEAREILEIDDLTPGEVEDLCFGTCCLDRREREALAFLLTSDV